MGIPTSWRDSRLSSAALEKSEFMVGNCENRVRAVPFHRIRSSVTRTRFQSARWRVRPHALIQFAHSPTISSVRSIAGEIRRPSPRVVGVQLEIRL
jgi:hypothetical protein